MAFRLPGDLSSDEQLWDALIQGKDLVTQIDASRWAVDRLQHPTRSEPGRSITFAAGVLSHIDQFDANFFGISPREAELLDPQQRLLLELAWESLEDAGIPAGRLAGSNTGVYLGISGLDYGMRMLDDLSVMAAHSMTGNTMSMAANRLSYFFDMHGPSFAVDTACSSSLVALHQACNALNQGEVDAALVGGVNLLLHPYPFVGFTKASMLSSYGRSRAFGANGEGYVRGEGAVVMLLKPLARAQRDGDRIHAVIRASGVNTDGARKSGLTIPSVEGQIELMRAVLARSGLAAGDIDYIEAHGTGTAIGDPIEANTIGTVYGTQPRSRALPIGSIKSNIGHLEPASGLAGLVKAVLVLQRGEIPPTLHAQTLNPHIDFAGLGLQPVQAAMPLPPADRPRYAAVNSFGFGGANAHVILQVDASPATVRRQGPAKARSRATSLPLVISARHDAALRALAGRYGDLLDAGADPQDLCASAWLQRDWLGHRLALRRLDEHSVQALRAYAHGGKPGDALVIEKQLPGTARIALVYSGNGSQWTGMGRRLLDQSDTFRRHFAKASVLIRAHGGPDVQAILASDDPAVLADTANAQPALFALQVAITETLRAQGLEATAATGHSVGEIAAAWACGALTLDQAARVIVARSRAQAPLRGHGTMAVVGLSGEAAQARIDELGLTGQVSVAAENSRQTTTVSGTAEALKQLQTELRASGVSYIALDLDYAFHSASMDPIRDHLLADLADLAPPTTGAGFYSTVSGTPVAHATLGADYWWQNVRQPVRFRQAIEHLLADGYRVFVEVGPHAIMQRHIADAIAAAQLDGKALANAPRHEDTLDRLDEAVLRATLLTMPAVATPATGSAARRRLNLPRYPWQRQHHWYRTTAESAQLLERPVRHPLLGSRQPDRQIWENALDPARLPWLADHQVGGAVVLPGAAFADMALAAAIELTPGDLHVVEQLEIIAPVVFDAEHARSLRTQVDEQGRFRIEGRLRLSADPWALHARGRLRTLPADAGASSSASLPEPATPATTVTGDEIYAAATALGLNYGPDFQRLASLQADARSLCATLTAAPLPGADHALHPALLDQCFQSVIAWFARDVARADGAGASPLTAALAYLPVGIQRLTVPAGAGTRVATQFRGRLVRQNPRSLLADFELLDAQGGLIARAQGVRLRAALLGSARQRQLTWQDRLEPAPLPKADQLAPLPPTAVLLEPCQKPEAHDTLARRARYFHDLAPLLETLPLAFARDALASAQTLDDTVARWTVGHPLQQWLLARLQDHGLLAHGDAGWALHDHDIPATATLWAAALREFPAAAPELSRLAQVGLHLGELAPQATGEFTPVALDTQAPSQEFAWLSLRQILAHLLVRRPRRRRLRVLEVSFSDTRLVPAVVPDPGAAHIDYVVGAISGSTRKEAPGISTLALHPETLAPSDELPDGQRFDLVILHQSLNQARQLPQGLRRYASSLSADGILLVAERAPDLAGHLLLGEHPAWWRQAGADSPAQGRLISREAWQAVFGELGWLDLQVLEDPAAGDLSLGSFVLIARPPKVADSGREVRAAALSWSVDALDPDWSALVPTLQEGLQAAGHRVEATPAPASNRVFLVGGKPRPLSAHDLAQTCDTLRQLLLSAARETPAPTVWVVTHGGAPGLEGDTSNPEAAALWAMVRVAQNELYPLPLRLIDLPDAQPLHAAALLQELAHPDAALELALSPTGRERVVADAWNAPLPGAPARWTLDFPLAGQLRNLHWREDEAKTLGPHDIEIRAGAAGLNFRDIMYAMGLLSDEALEQGFAGAALGLEVAGRVVRCGSAVTAFAPGDEVLAFAGASLASHVVVHERGAVRKPAAWSDAEAATVPTVFFTVWYALVQLANLRRGETVLIHGAAGGVGLAAIQVAQYLGARIIASAGSPEKRDFVRMLGVDDIIDSRNPDFDEAVLACTQGQGVDLVLNSLAGSAIERNLRVLKPFGRFVELGKRDFYEDTPIGLRPFRNNISYFGVDADQLMQVRPDVAQGVFTDMMARFHAGDLTPLPHKVFAPDAIVDAFRHMQQARQIGKVVVDLTTPPHQIAQRAHTPHWQASPDGAYLVTGGISGFGLEAARWLAGRGARALVLLSRRGADTPGADAALASLRLQGLRVHVVAADVADREALQAALAQLPAALGPLRGVVHAAMVLDDGLLDKLTADRFERVLAPKLQGAWNLHDLTRHLPLDLFLMFSSATTWMGNAGQANYVAANAGLEGLARKRQRLGLPALAVAWGPIADVGVLTRNQTARDGLESRLGAPPMTASAALAQLDATLVSGAPVVTVLDFAWATLQGLLPSAKSARFDHLRATLGSSDGAHGQGDLRARLLALTETEAIGLITEVLVTEAAGVLRMAPADLPQDQAMTDLGLDSLMAVELALALEKRFAITLPPMLISENPSIKRIAERVWQAVRGGSAGASSDTTRDLVQAMAAVHAEEGTQGIVDSVVESLRQSDSEGGDSRLIA